MKAKDAKLNDALLVAGIRNHLSNVITEHFVRMELEKFEIMVREAIKPLVETVVLEGINTHRSHFGEKLIYEVHMKWLEDKKEAT